MSELQSFKKIFLVFLHHFVSAKLATSSIRINMLSPTFPSSFCGSLKNLASFLRKSSYFQVHFRALGLATDV